MVSYSAKERHGFVKYTVGWHGYFNCSRWKKRGLCAAQGHGLLGCQLKHCLAVLNGKGELIPAGGKADSRAASQGAGKWLSASSASDYWHAVRNVNCYWDCWNGKKFEWGSFWTYWKLLRPSSFIILQSCWSRMLMVWPDLQDQANWGGLLRTFKRTYVSFCIWTESYWRVIAREEISIALARKAKANTLKQGCMVVITVNWFVVKLQWIKIGKRRICRNCEMLIQYRLFSLHLILLLLTLWTWSQSSWRAKISIVGSEALLSRCEWGVTLSSRALQKTSSPLPFLLSISEHELPGERSRAQTKYPKSLFRNQLLSTFPSEFSQVVVEQESEKR